MIAMTTSNSVSVKARYLMSDLLNGSKRTQAELSQLEDF